MLSDLINASFEGLAAAVSFLNIRQILKDKAVRGVSGWPVAFFTVWGLWNLYYYPSLGQYFSAVAAAGMVSINVWWLALYRKYKNDNPSP